METKKLGSSGPELSVIGFGAWEAGGDAWGANESEDSVIAAMHAALDAGITWMDTAEVYGSGRSEQLVGRAVMGRREDVLIATKVAPQPGGTGFRPDQVPAACEGSLRRLGVEHIDLYQLHWQDGEGVPIEDTWGAMAGLQDAGKVRHLGVSNFDRTLIERCEPIRHVDSLQQEFSLLTLDDRDLIRWCGEVGTGVVSYGPLGFGLLTGSSHVPTQRVCRTGEPVAPKGPSASQAWTTHSGSWTACARSRNGCASRWQSSRSRGTGTSRA